MAEGALFHLAGKVLGTAGFLNSPRDEEKQSSHSRQIKDWLRKLKDVLHDADDLLDDFFTEVLRHKVMTKRVRLFSSSSNSLIALSPKMANEIKAIRERLNAIAKDKEDFHFIQSSLEPQVMNRDRETYSFVLEEEIFGREKDKKEIIEHHFDGNVLENISIIPTVGIGGLGKTTLAQLVYNDESVKSKFELKLWVCISDIFEVKLIVKEILKQLTKEKFVESLVMLQNQLRENLNGKKYLLVLDDLWNEDNNKWLLLRNLLMVGARGSRLMVTTRSERVTRTTRATSWYALRSLPEEKAWGLFVEVAFEQGQLPENEAFVSLAKEIVEKCVGSNDDDVNEPHHLLLPSFPHRLSQLKILGCPNLTCMPLFPYLKEELTLDGASLKELEQGKEMKAKMGAATTSTSSSSSSCYFPLSRLQSLWLKNVNHLESLPKE
uniref:Uncharacterized protein n=1 Tax=Quercus lobata TaxID=97700 RepID=A0A7N2LE50_QUELO